MQITQITYKFDKNHSIETIGPVSGQTFVSKNDETFEYGEILILKQNLFAQCAIKLLVCVNLYESYYGFEPKLKIQYISHRMNNAISGIKIAIAIFKANFEDFEAYLEFYTENQEVLYVKDALNDVNEISEALNKLPEFLFEYYFSCFLI